MIIQRLFGSSRVRLAWSMHPSTLNRIRRLPETAVRRVRTLDVPVWMLVCWRCAGMLGLQTDDILLETRSVPSTPIVVSSTGSVPDIDNGMRTRSVAVERIAD